MRKKTWKQDSILLCRFCWGFWICGGRCGMLESENEKSKATVEVVLVVPLVLMVIFLRCR